MTYILIISLLYIAGCVGLIARGGGYIFVGPGDTGQILDRVIYSPMVELRQGGHFYIRDHLFAGVFLTPFYMLPFLYLFGFSFWYLLPVQLGWAASILTQGIFTKLGVRRWGECIDMRHKGDFTALFIRSQQYILLFGGISLTAYLLGQPYDDMMIIVPIGVTVLYGLITPLMYKFTSNNEWFNRFTTRPTNYSEFFSNGVLFAVLIFLTIILTGDKL